MPVCSFPGNDINHTCYRARTEIYENCSSVWRHLYKYKILC